MSLPVQPELFILLSVNIRTALERVKLSGKMSERYDDVSVLTQVIDSYDALWSRHWRDNNPRWWRVDANGPLDDVMAQVGHVALTLQPSIGPCCARCGKCPKPGELSLSKNPNTGEWICFDCGYGDATLVQLKQARDSAVAMSEERLREAIALRGENERLRTRNAELSKLTGDLEFERDELAKYKRRNPA